MAQTSLDICNGAISLAGGEPVDAISEDTPVGAFCLLNYERTRGWLLSRHRWVFATRIARLSRIADADLPTVQPAPHAFIRPGDLLGVVHAFRSRAQADTQPVYPLEIEGRYWTEETELWAEYTANKPEDQWPPWFEKLVVTAFASEVARYYQQRSLANDLYTIAFGTPADDGEGGLYRAARQEDGRAAPHRQMYGFDAGPLIDARFVSGTPGPFKGGDYDFIDFP